MSVVDQVIGFLGYERVYLPFYKVADTYFMSQGVVLAFLMGNDKTVNLVDCLYVSVCPANTKHL